MIDFLVIGAQRGGTKSMYDYLMHHPGVVPAVKPAVHFFDVHYEMGLEWYIRHFPMLSGYYGGKKLTDHITGEASSCYLHHPLAPERIKKHCPQAKLIVMLRNPTDRAYSHYRNAVRQGKETLSFSMALKVEAKRLEKGLQRLHENPAIYAERNLMHSYISHGLYANQVKRWLACFPREQFMFIRSEDFFANPVDTAMKTYDFLGLPPFQPPALPPPDPNYFECLTELTRSKIDRFFTQSNEEVSRILHWQPAWETDHGIRAK